MLDLKSELMPDEIEEVASHLESSAPLLLETKPGSPKMFKFKIDMLEERPQPEKYQDESILGKVVDSYRDARVWQFGVGPVMVLYVLSSFITQGSLRID